VGLISNFTHAPVIHKSLRKVGIHRYFNAIVVSDEVGCRKPCPDIFNILLGRLKVKPGEAVFIGDSPLEDIKGGKDVGLRTVFVPSQFNSIKDLQASKQKPDEISKDLNSIAENLGQLLC
jgi:putative hydrolase of the HAD superfamily